MNALNWTDRRILKHQELYDDFLSDAEAGRDDTWAVQADENKLIELAINLQRAANAQDASIADVRDLIGKFIRARAKDHADFEIDRPHNDALWEDAA